MRRKIPVGWLVFVVAAFGSLPLFADLVKFRVNDPMRRNVVRFESKPPLETIAATTGRIEGTVMIDPNDLTVAPYAEFEVDPASLDTGIELRNRHMQTQYLEVERFPSIRFELKEIVTASRNQLKDGEPVDLKGAGVFYLHGVSREIQVDLRVIYLEESEQTRQKMPGNLWKIEAHFELDFDDFKIPVPQLVALKLDAHIKLYVDVFATDAAEEKNQEGQ